MAARRPCSLASTPPISIAPSRRIGDIVFDRGHGLALDVYAPAHASHAPIVVFFYGGTWVRGERAWYRFVGTALAAHGVVTVIPDYRKYPQVMLEGFMQDAASAVAWAHEHAVEIGGSPDDIFVMGHSAGGQIAALLATDPQWLAAHDLKPADLAGSSAWPVATISFPCHRTIPSCLAYSAARRNSSAEGSLCRTCAARSRPCCCCRVPTTTKWNRRTPYRCTVPPRPRMATARCGPIRRRGPRSVAICAVADRCAMVRQRMVDTLSFIQSHPLAKPPGTLH